MLTYPSISPIALQIGAIKIYWYGLMYVIGFIIAWILAIYLVKDRKNFLTTEQVSDLIFYCALGVILGGRLGYALIYSVDFYHHPLSIIKIWEGGMSFHGGLIGVIIAFFLFAKKVKRNFLTIADFVSPFVPIGLFLGRIGNFINSELWGRVTTVPWGMVFPNGGSLPRHPSQLYEALLEGLVLFIILWIYSKKPRPEGRISGLFLIGYGIARIVCEFFRNPDPQIGYIAFGWLTMGQLLSLPMIIIGLLLFYKKSKRLSMS